jgi:hypothetical protein
MGISTSIGFYDFLNYLTIGAILSFIFVPWLPKSTEELALWAMPCFVVGLIFHKVVENSIGNYTRNNKDLIEEAYKDKISYCDFKIYKPCDMEKEYYRAYYCLLSNKELGNIPILEAMSSFFQDLFCVITLYVSVTFLYWVYICFNIKPVVVIDWSVFVYYGIATTFIFLMIIFIVYSVPWQKMTKVYSELVRYVSYIAIILLLVLMAIAGTISIKYISLNINSITFHLCSYCCNVCYTDVNIASNMIILPLKYTLPMLGFSLVLLLLLPILRYFTEKKIFGLVWEGYIFMHLNKKINQLKGI